MSRHTVSRNVQPNPNPAAGMLRAPLAGPTAWTRDTVGEERWRFELDEACRREIAGVVQALRANPIDMLLLDHRSFDMPNCAALMRRVQDELDSGGMFVLLRGLELNAMSKDEARRVYWLLCSLFSRPVAQRFDGTMTFEVLDRKVPVVPGSGIRPTVSNVDMTFHNDNSYNRPQPDYIALLCLGTPLHGGTSRVASAHTVHNRLLRDHPEALERLYRPFWYDRYREHAEGESGIASHPVFAWDGSELECRVAIPEIIAGYALAGEEMDRETLDAIAALRAVFAEPEMAVEFQMARGDIQIVNNRHALHSRTDFVDSEDESSRRHLLRLWLRNQGARTYTALGARPG